MKRYLKKILNLKSKKGEIVRPNPSGQEFEVNNWLISEFILDKLIPAVGIHPFPLNELHFLVASMCYFQPEQVFEWGTNIGKSARIFYETSQHFNINCEIHSIDLPDDVDHVEHPFSKRGYLVKGLPGVQLHQGDGISRAIEISKLNINLRSLVFVDGDHSYSSVKRELELISLYLPNAAIVLHDTFNQSSESGYNVGPYQAVVEFVASSSQQYCMKTTNLGLPGMTMLYKPQYLN